MKQQQEKDDNNLNEQVSNFGKSVFILSFFVKIKEVHVVTEQEHAKGIVNKMDPLFVELGVYENVRTNKPRKPICHHDYLDDQLSFILK